jgi:hypothetical protein
VAFSRFQPTGTSPDKSEPPDQTWAVSNQTRADSNQVLAGYLGDPAGRRAWIETALEQGQRAGRWPDTALDLTGGVVKNKFDDRWLKVAPS